MGSSTSYYSDNRGSSSRENFGGYGTSGQQGRRSQEHDSDRFQSHRSERYRNPEADL
jgi:hypothetical protein